MVLMTKRYGGGAPQGFRVLSLCSGGTGWNTFHWAWFKRPKFHSIFKRRSCEHHYESFSKFLFCTSIWAILAKIKLPKKKHGIVTFWIKWVRILCPISSVSNSIQRIKFDRNSTSESAAAFLSPVRLVLSIQTSNFCSVESNSYIMLMSWAYVNLVPTKRKKKLGHSRPNATWAYCKTNCCIAIPLADNFSHK